MKNIKTNSCSCRSKARLIKPHLRQMLAMQLRATWRSSMLCCDSELYCSRSPPSLSKQLTCCKWGRSHCQSSTRRSCKKEAHVYLLTVRPIAVHHCRECQDHIRVSPRTAVFESSDCVVQEHIESLFVHDDLKKRNVNKKLVDDWGTPKWRRTLPVTFSWLRRWWTSWQNLTTKCSWLSGTRQLVCFSREHTSWNGSHQKLPQVRLKLRMKSAEKVLLLVVCWRWHRGFCCSSRTAAGRKAGSAALSAGRCLPVRLGALRSIEKNASQPPTDS